MELYHTHNACQTQDWEHIWVVQNAWKQFGALCSDGKVRIQTDKAKEVHAT